MGAFIGPLGGLIELAHYQESQSISQGADPSFFTGLDGAKTAFIQPRAGLALREWSVAQSMAMPEQAAAFHTLALGGMGVGPFAFVDPLAQWNNVLTPRQSLMDPELMASASPGANITPTVMPVPGFGSAPAGLVTSKSTGFWGWNTPVMPGRPLTLSLMVHGQAEITLRIMRNEPAWPNRHTEVRTVETTSPERVTITFNRPWFMDSQMCGIQIRTTSSVTIAQPQITWLDYEVPWSVGRGAAQVVVSGFDEDYERTGRFDGQRVIGYAAKVTEVGHGA